MARVLPKRLLEQVQLWRCENELTSLRRVVNRCVLQPVAALLYGFVI